MQMSCILAAKQRKRFLYGNRLPRIHGLFEPTLDEMNWASLNVGNSVDANPNRKANTEPSFSGDADEGVTSMLDFSSRRTAGETGNAVRRATHRARG